MHHQQFYVYILSNKQNGTLYTGMTSNLAQRIWQHKNEKVEGFTKKYGIKNLVYFEPHDDALGAATRERQIKKWRRAWKIKLIEELNPEWDDLFEDICR